MANTLTQLVRQEVKNFFDEKIGDKIFTNEQHLQAHLHRWLEAHLPQHQGCKNAKVHIEYYVPMQSFNHLIQGEIKSAYLWEGERIYVDLVVECDGQFVPIELKYKTEKYKTEKYKTEQCKTQETQETNDKIYHRFGEDIGNFILVTDQVATNEGYYNCWKDVKRLELLAERFPKVEGGLFVFLTNSHLYLNKPKRANCKSQNFAWHERTEEEDNNPKCWFNKQDAKNRPDLTLAQGYAVEWHPKPQDEHNPNVFHYCLIEVDALTVRAANQPPKIWDPKSKPAQNQSQETKKNKS